MNKITYAGAIEAFSQRVCKNYEVIIPSENGEISFGGTVKELCAQDAVVIPPRTAYSLNCGGRLIVLEQAILPVKSVTVIKDSDGEVANAAGQAKKYFSSTLPKKDLIISSLGGLLVSYITAFSAVSGFSPVVDIVRAEIAKGVSDSTFSLEDFMKKLPLNYDYVRKLFKKEMGVTPHEYLLRERMELARSLILSGISNQYSGYSVSQIAEACGFSEPLYFSRVFKKYFGVAPSEYK